MKSVWWAVTLSCLLLSSCDRSKKTPDVSQIQVKLTFHRFDKAFFKLDTTQLTLGLQKLADRFPDFYAPFMQGMLEVSGDPADSTTIKVTKEFLNFHRSLYDSLLIQFNDTQKIEEEFLTSFKYLHYYFPNYRADNITFFMGPFFAPGVAIIENGTAVGLHQYGGADFFVYQTPELQMEYPTYLSRRFAAPYMVPNAMKGIIQDLFPPQQADLPLLQQMVEKGKYWYLASLLLPNHPDTLITGYTKKQLDWCTQNEGLIWSHLLKNEDLNSINPMIIRNYLDEAPFTQGLPRDYSPGNLGSWIGWQIVKKYAALHPNLSPEALMRTTPSAILEKAKYKPK